MFQRVNVKYNWHQDYNALMDFGGPGKKIQLEQKANEALNWPGQVSTKTVWTVPSLGFNVDTEETLELFESDGSGSSSKQQIVPKGQQKIEPSRGLNIDTPEIKPRGSGSNSVRDENIKQKAPKGEQKMPMGKHGRQNDEEQLESPTKIHKLNTEISAEDWISYQEWKKSQGDTQK